MKMPVMLSLLWLLMPAAVAAQTATPPKTGAWARACSATTRKAS